MNQYENSTEDEVSTKASFTSTVEDLRNEHLELEDEDDDDDDDDMSSSSIDNSQSQLDVNCATNCNSKVWNGLRWDRTRSRRYNLEMLREYEQTRTKEIISRILKLQKLTKGAQRLSDEEDDAITNKTEVFSGPDPRGVYARIESRWRSENCPPSPQRQPTTSTHEKMFSRKATGVFAAAKFKTKKK